MTKDMRGVVREGEEKVSGFVDSDGNLIKVHSFASCDRGHRRVFWDLRPNGPKGDLYACPICCAEYYSRKK